MNIYGQRDITSWMNDDKVKRGCTKYNVPYIRKLREIDEQFKRNNCILYYVSMELGIKKCASMMKSSKRQSEFIYAAIQSLKEKELTKEYVPAFERNITSFKKRSEHIHRVLKEILYLTDTYPFFESVGFQSLEEFDMKQGSDGLSYLKDEIRKFNAENPELLKMHMERIQPDLERELKARKTRKEHVKVEKEFEKFLKDREKREQRQIKKETEALRAKEKKLEKSFERYYKKQIS